jgi:hypothetical protein
MARGNLSRIHIMPVTEVENGFPTCDHCTWVATGFRKFRLKYINRACRIHGNLECV